ncbi:MAG: alpha/beta hydrolase [Halioglobus sp.]|nr:alpha/beta hydrolase [Halioglobus sp.]
MAYDIDDNGTVDLGGNDVPVPGTISPEAQSYIAQDLWGTDTSAAPMAMWETRQVTALAFDALNQQAQAMFPVTIEETKIDGVRCHRVSPLQVTAENRDKVLINFHGGGFVIGSGSLVEAIPIAHLTGIEVIAVDYRLAPEHPYPAAVDDAIAVYRDTLKTRSPADIAIYGSSAGGFITGQLLARAGKEGLPMPACAGVFSAGGDLIDFGDTSHIFTLNGFFGHLLFPLDHELSEVRAYLGGADPRDPLISPVLSDLSGFPPVLLMSGTRDAILSATSNFHRALRRAGVDADLMVFDAMPHTHWYALHLPETNEALGVMAEFFTRHLCPE